MITSARLGTDVERIPFEIAVAAGMFRTVKTFRKFGMNDGVASGTEEMWPVGTTKVLPTSGGQFSAVSDSIQDDMTTGTGTWTLTVEGLDTNFVDKSETIEMNGTTPVLSADSDWFRINRAYGVQAGSTSLNVGNLSISIGGNLQAYIEALEGQTHQTHYTVPANKNLIITAFTIGVGRMAGTSDFHVLSQIKLFGTTHWRTISDIYLYDGQIHNNEKAVTLIPTKTEIRQRIVSTTATQAYSTYSGFLYSTSTP